MRQSSFQSHNVSFATETAAIVKQAQIYTYAFLFVSLAMNVLDVLFQSRRVQYCFLSFVYHSPRLCAELFTALVTAFRQEEHNFYPLISYLAG